MSLIGQVGPFLLFGVAAHLITSADMALMMGSAPIFTFVLARMFGLGEVWNARAAAGLALGLVGVALSLGSPFAGGGGGARRTGANPRARRRARLRRQRAAVATGFARGRRGDGGDGFDGDFRRAARRG